jgi:phospholipid/cholesterol/gamma-HCH transport system substrate-binding protein
MSAKTNNIRIGIFVLVGVVIFIAGLLAFGAKSYFVKKEKFETAMEGEVYGLSVGSKVELRGVPIGKVSDIDFGFNIYPKSKTDVIVVEFEVDGEIFNTIRTAGQRTAYREEQITKGLRAMIKGQGVTGTSLLALEYLDPARNPPPAIDYKPRYAYIPSAAGQFTRILESIESSLRHLQDINVASIGHSISNVLESTRQLMDKVNKVDLGQIATNANGLLVELKSSVGELDTTIKGMKLDALSQNADGLITGLKETNLKLQTVLDKVGAVPMQDTVGDIRSAIQTLNDVLLELKQYPSGFIFGKPPLPAKSVETPSK